MTHYLVKWCSLSYEEATWELQEDLDASKIKEFEEIQKIPADLRYIVRTQARTHSVHMFLLTSVWMFKKVIYFIKLVCL